MRAPKLPRVVSIASVLAALLLMPQNALAQVRQPDGHPGAHRTQRRRTERERHPPGARRDQPRAADDALRRPGQRPARPANLPPGCRISFRVVARFAGDLDAFGWYNVVPGRSTPPPPTERYEMVRGQHEHPDGRGRRRLRRHPQHRHRPAVHRRRHRLLSAKHLLGRHALHRAALPGPGRLPTTSTRSSTTAA